MLQGTTYSGPMSRGLRTHSPEHRCLARPSCLRQGPLCARTDHSARARRSSGPRSPRASLRSRVHCGTYGCDALVQRVVLSPVWGVFRWSAASSCSSHFGVPPCRRMASMENGHSHSRRRVCLLDDLRNPRRPQPPGCRFAQPLADTDRRRQPPHRFDPHRRTVWRCAVSSSRVSRNSLGGRGSAFRRSTIATLIRPLRQPIEYERYNPFTPSWPEHDLGRSPV